VPEQVKIIRSDRVPFVWAPEQQKWLDPWQVTMKLNLPGLPVRWRQVSHASLEERTYCLTTREGGGPARWLQFRVGPSGWETESDGLIMWATNYMELGLYGRRLEGYNPRRKKTPGRRFGKYLLWQVQEIGLQDALVSLPQQPGETFAVSKRELQFLEAEPTALELRLQQLGAMDQESLPPNYPLKYTGYLLEKGRWQRPYLPGHGDQVYVYRRFDAWEDLRQRHTDLTVDEALVSIQAGMGKMPEYGVQDPDHILSQRNMDLWHTGHWTESDVEAMRAAATLVQLEQDLVEAAMRAVESFRDFMSRGGSAILPAPR
jgi:hypothetical protein